MVRSAEWIRSRRRPPLFPSLSRRPRLRETPRPPGNHAHTTGPPGALAHKGKERGGSDGVRRTTERENTGAAGYPRDADDPHSRPPPFHIGQGNRYTTRDVKSTK